MTTTRSGPGRAAGLTREGVLDAAIELVERDGPTALTMRRLGTEVGVEAMSIYHHLANRDAVLAGMAERVMSRVRCPPAELGWREAAAFFARQLREVATGSPRTFAMTAMRPLPSATALVPVEALLQVVVRDGASPADALVLYRSVASYARGYALAEVAGFTVDAASELGRSTLEGLDDDAFPILGGRTAELRGAGPDAAFERGLDALLTGFGSTPARGGS